MLSLYFLQINRAGLLFEVQSQVIIGRAFDDQMHRVVISTSIRSLTVATTSSRHFIGSGCKSVVCMLPCNDPHDSYILPAPLQDSESLGNNTPSRIRNSLPIARFFSLFHQCRATGATP